MIVLKQQNLEHAATHLVLIQWLKMSNYSREGQELLKFRAERSCGAERPYKFKTKSSLLGTKMSYGPKRRDSVLNLRCKEHIVLVKFLFYLTPG